MAGLYKHYIKKYIYQTEVMQAVINVMVKLRSRLFASIAIQL